LRAAAAMGVGRIWGRRRERARRPERRQEEGRDGWHFLGNRLNRFAKADACNTL